MAARDTMLADAIAAATRDFDTNLVLVGLAGSELPHAGMRAGLGFAHEAFVDRRYEADGSLTPRGEADALLGEHASILAQALAIAAGRGVPTRQGKILPLQADTLCVHGDRPDAGVLARSLREALQDEGFEVRAPSMASCR
jgi:5-oxoprolinase (ATP-hydrolysing) subunit A